MHFVRFTTEGTWDTFELANADYINDPRPAVYELASLLAGENREAYTVKFARYTGTMYDGVGTAGYSSLASAGFGAGYCYGSAPLGFAWSPFAIPYGGLAPMADASGDFYYRGTEYLYNSFGNCYTTLRSGGYFGNYYGTQIAQGANPPTQTPARIFNIDKVHTPPTPQPLPGYKLPVGGSGGAANPSGATPRVSTHYRDRGLLTPDDGSSTTPTQRNARIDARTVGENSRPSIQEMINRHEEGAGRQTGNAAGGNDGWSRAQGTRNYGNGAGTGSQTPRSDGGQSGAQRQFSPDGRNSGGQSQPRSEPTRTAPSPAPSYSAPRSAPAASPPPAPAAPSAPASTGSSTGSGAPIKP
jgi:hypothetical protein